MNASEGKKHTNPKKNKDAIDYINQFSLCMCLRQ